MYAMRARHGCIVFASADWAQGWYDFVEGAIQEGTRAASKMKTELQVESEVIRDFEEMRKECPLLFAIHF